MPELLNVLFCWGECFFPSSLLDSVEGLDRNHDDDNCSNDGGDLSNTGYDVPGTILNALHVNSFDPRNNPIRQMMLFYRWED